MNDEQLAQLAEQVAAENPTLRDSALTAKLMRVAYARGRNARCAECEASFARMRDSVERNIGLRVAAERRAGELRRELEALKRKT